METRLSKVLTLPEVLVSHLVPFIPVSVSPSRLQAGG